MEKAVTLGTVRTTDELGRVVIPRDMRNHLGIKESTPLEITCANGVITMRPLFKAVDAACLAQSLIKAIEESAAPGKESAIQKIKDAMVSIIA